MSATPDLDPVSIAAAIVGSVIGPQLAPYIGAYSVILLAWVGGVIVGLYRRDPTSRMSAAGFIAVTFVMTLGLTAVIASTLAARISAESTTLLFPVAFMIPAVGDSWADIVRWVAGRLRAKWEKE
jgi:hypothetical protein